MNTYLKQYKGLPQAMYVLFFGRIVTNLGGMVWPMMTMILSQKMGMSALGVGKVLLLMGFGMIPANLLGGKLADRCNKKMVIVYCDLLSILFYVTCAIIPLSLLSIVLIVLGAVCQNMEGPSYNALIADITLTKDREKAYSLMYLGGNIGLILSPMIAGFLFHHFLWLAFLISGVAIGCSTILIYFKIQDITPVVDTSEEAQYQQGRDDMNILQILQENKSVVLFLAIIAIYYSCYNMWGYLMPLDMGKIHGDQGAVLYGSVTSLNCLIVVVCTPLITRYFSGKTEATRLIIGEMMVGIGYFVFLVFLGVIPMYYVAIALFTWGEIFTTITEGPYTTRRIPASHRGRLNGFATVFQSVLTAFFQVTTGFLYDQRGSASAWTFVIASLALAMALTFLLGVTDRRAYPALYRQAEA